MRIKYSAPWVQQTVRREKAQKSKEQKNGQQAVLLCPNGVPSLCAVGTEEKGTR